MNWILETEKTVGKEIRDRENLHLKGTIYLSIYIYQNGS